LDKKVNSASEFNENSYEKTERNQERLLLAKLMSPSMDPLFKIGDEVPVRIKSIRTQFKKGDIIAFNRDGVIVLHQIIDSYMYKGKVYYVTGGLNPDTNPYVDSTTISRDAIIGKADLSENALAEIQDLAKQGRLPFFEVYGMPSYTINPRYQIDQTDISNYESNNLYDYLKINLLVDDISKIFDSDSDQFVKQLFQDQEFLKNVFNNEVMKIQYADHKLPNLLAEFFYSIYIMNPDNFLDSTFKNNKREALHKIEDYLESNGYNPNELGSDERKLFEEFYDKYMQIIDNSLKIEIDGRSTIITHRSLDPIEARIWYKVQEHNIIAYINEIFGNNLKTEGDIAKVASQLRNIFRVKTRNLMDDIEQSKYLMRTEPASIWYEILNTYKDPQIIIEKSMSGRDIFDRSLKRALVRNLINPNNNRYYRIYIILISI
jgi:hypothetical protein